MPFKELLDPPDVPALVRAGTVGLGDHLSGVGGD
jgi:hypothetical protein